MLDRTIVKRIYETIFNRIKRTEIDLFLCGGASTAKHSSTRDSLKEVLRNERNLAIYYPENLFAGILARKKMDLLTLEKILADNSDIIIIICESPGSFTELGAFVNSNDTCGKVVAFIQSKYKNDKSFINQGPIEYLRKHSERNTKVMYYNTDINQTKKMAKEALSETSVIRGKKNVRYDLGLISGQVCFIMLLLYFFDSVKYDDLRETVSEMRNNKNTPADDSENIIQFDMVYSAAIKRLYGKGYLIKREDLGCYRLSKTGYLRVEGYLKSIDSKRQIDGIRLDSLRKSYYRHGFS